jgi:putative GTP pyrophosphokinase
VKAKFSEVAVKKVLFLCPKSAFAAYLLDMAKRSRKVPKSAAAALEAEYHATAADSASFALEVVRQLTEIFSQQGLSLAVPIEHRVKSWQSISEKLERKSLELNHIADLDDLVGVRSILLFRRDVDTATRLVADKFKVIKQEDTISRLGESQFGYSSIHFTVQVPPEWLKVPTLARFAGYKAEVQIRTIAQHLWAASSHVLQYKQEAGVPPPVRRSIFRVSALLETVDLEFERVLTEREQYSRQVDVTSKEEILNVDLIEKVLDTLLPKENRKETEPYSELLADLFAFSVVTPQALEQLIKETETEVQASEASTVEKRKEEKDYTGTSRGRIERGVFFSHVGLVRQALHQKFKSRWNAYNRAKYLGVSELNLSQEAQAVLENANIEKVVDLAGKTEAEVLRYGGMNTGVMEQINEALKSLGISLGMPRFEALFKMSAAAPKHKK